MNNVFENFNPEALFSVDNPFIKSAQKTHELVAEAFDRSARLQLTLAEDLLDLNQKRFASIYTGGSIQDTIAAQQDVLTETGNRLSAYAEGIQEVYCAQGSKKDQGKSSLN
jgi:hypothetical protein